MVNRQKAIEWSTSKITRPERWKSLATKGATVWLTGLSGSGKSSIAKHMEADLVDEGVSAYVLDGDNLRHGLNRDLGFSREDRGENARRAAEVAKLFADSGSVALVALISPYAEDRAFARKIHEDDGLPFVEVYVCASLEVCEGRDPKGLYARARTGEITEFTSVSDPYEEPLHPDLVLRTAQGTIDDAAHEALGLLRSRLA
ncbi:MAG TPA: adenylyl-sulfate kinase [Acidimicrobiales bacterium]|nr:adenylyl-sulfate kinase [Acidimicrobiales bacterium]